MTIEKALFGSAWLCVLLAIGSGAGRAQEAAPPDDGLALWLDFEEVVDNQFVCAAPGGTLPRLGAGFGAAGCLAGCVFQPCLRGRRCWA